MVRVCLRHLGFDFLRVSVVVSISATVAKTFVPFWGNNKGWFLGSSDGLGSLLL